MNILNEIDKYEDSTVLPAVNIRNTGEYKWADWIVDGKKTIETRQYLKTNSKGQLTPLVGKGPIKIIRTGEGKAQVIGEAEFGKPIFYETKEQFDADYDKHLVKDDSAFAYSEGGKWGYPVTNPKRYEQPYEAPHPRGMIFTWKVDGPRS